jgi:hypothetical protein
MIFKSSVASVVLFVTLSGHAIDARRGQVSGHESSKQDAGKKQPEGKAGGGHSQHPSGVNERGDHAMGFSHEKTTHHFRLMANGGAIEVTANDSKDAESRDQIRMHLSHIAGLFKEGDFSKPLFTHGKVPPGAPAMARLKAEIDYSYQEIERGARVMITTTSADALSAIHEFLRFQIKEHETGDPLEVAKDN